MPRVPRPARKGGTGRVRVDSVEKPWMWVAFVGFVLAMLALDLGVFHRRQHAVRAREALLWSAVWIALALVFGAAVFAFIDPDKGVEYLAGYLVEKSLSVDNLFVFVVLFETLAIPDELQHRVLFWGVLSALVLRGAMIVGGAALVERFHWILYVFGAFLVLTGWKLWQRRGGPLKPGEGRVLAWVRRAIPSTPHLRGAAFVVEEGGRRVATPLLVALVAIELADVAFAVDSIPAVFAVTTDPFIVFTSNAFAILGLRALYFVLADLVARLVYLRVGLAAVLVFVGLKMLAAPFVRVPSWVSLTVIAGILGGTVLASLRKGTRAVRADPGARGGEAS